MQQMKFFIDTHDATNGTYPAGLTPEQFESFFAKYESSCYEEGVIPLRVHVGYGDNRAFCFTMAPDAAAVRRAHIKAGLPTTPLLKLQLQHLAIHSSGVRPHKRADFNTAVV